MAIDPGASTGWAIFDSGFGTLVDCGACKPPGLPWTGIQRVICEMPQKYPHDNIPPGNLITLAYRLGLVVGPLMAQGAVVVTVTPHEWKGTTPKDLCHRRSRAKLSPAELVLLDSALGGLKGKSDDMLDAVALGQYAILAGLWR